MSDNHSVKTYRRRLTPIERFFMRSPFAIVTMAARIRGSVTESMVRDTVAKVRQRHPNLRGRIIEDEDGTPWLTSEGAGEIPVTTVPRESDDHWIRVAQESSQIPFEFAARPSWRFVAAHLFQTLVMFLVIGGVLFLAAGRVDWWAAWAFLIVYFLIALVTTGWMLRTNPALVQEAI